MRISAELPQGVAALLFEAAERRRRLEATLTSLLEEGGFEEVILPILDYVEPYEPLLTPASRGELYRFVDRDGELLALRADFTPMLARLLAPGLASLPLPLRLYYRGDVVRYEEERAGRQREFYQVGAELVGSAGESAEREMLRLFLALLGAVDGTSVTVVLGFAGALDRLLAHPPADLDPAALARAVRRREREVVRQADAALLEVLERGVPERPEVLGEEAAERLARLQRLAGELAGGGGVRLAVDLAEFAHHTLSPELEGVGGGPEPAADPLARGYYDGIVFRAYLGAAGLPVGGGGRYDRLFRRLGAEVPAVGFSVGLDRLLDASADRAAGPPPASGGRDR